MLGGTMLADTGRKSSNMVPSGCRIPILCGWTSPCVALGCSVASILSHSPAKKYIFTIRFITGDWEYLAGPPFLFLVLRVFATNRFVTDSPISCGLCIFGDMYGFVENNSKHERTEIATRLWAWAYVGCVNGRMGAFFYSISMPLTSFV